MSSQEALLLIASVKGDLRAVEKLIRGGADVNKGSASHSGATPLYVACEVGHHEIVKALIKAGANPNLAVSGCLPLGLAAEQGHAKCIDALIEGGVDKDSKERGDRTALHHATGLLKTASVRALLKGGANPNIRDGSTGFTPLFMAAQSGKMETTYLLLKYGADTEITHVSGYTPLYKACFHLHNHMLPLLLQAGANIEARLSKTDTLSFPTEAGMTPLIIMAWLATEAPDGRKGGTDFHRENMPMCKEVIKALLEAGADPEARNDEGKRASDYLPAVADMAQSETAIRARAERAANEGKPPKARLLPILMCTRETEFLPEDFEVPAAVEEVVYSAGELRGKSVKELKQIMTGRGVNFVGLTEKSELVDKIMSTQPAESMEE
eukprot:gene1708-33114_t